MDRFFDRPNQDDVGQFKPGSSLDEFDISVLSLLARGFTSHNVAQRMYVSKTLVDACITRIYSKLEVDNPMLAVRKAYRLGLLAQDSLPDIEVPEPASEHNPS